MASALESPREVLFEEESLESMISYETRHYKNCNKILQKHVPCLYDLMVRMQTA